jgi:hypothetical protein
MGTCRFAAKLSVEAYTYMILRRANTHEVITITPQIVSRLLIFAVMTCYAIFDCICSTYSRVDVAHTIVIVSFGDPTHRRIICAHTIMLFTSHALRRVYNTRAVTHGGYFVIHDGYFNVIV